jgi:hypothetical protein
MISFTLGQLEPARRGRLEEIVAAGRSHRPIHRISMEALDKSDDWAQLVVDDGSGPQTVGQAHPHGEWVEIYPG